MSIYAMIYYGFSLAAVFAFFWWLSQPDVTQGEGLNLLFGKSSALSNFTANVCVLLVSIFLWPVLLLIFFYITWKKKNAKAE